MKKRLIFKTALMFLLFSCNNSSSDVCFGALKLIKEQECNIIVSDNINKSSHWGGGGYLKFKGIEISTGKEVIYKSKERSWLPLNEFVNVGDTVVKNEGEAIMYVYKRDSIVKRDLSNLCKSNFDWNKDVYTFILRDTVK